MCVYVRLFFSIINYPRHAPARHKRGGGKPCAVSHRRAMTLFYREYVGPTSGRRLKPSLSLRYRLGAVIGPFGGRSERKEIPGHFIFADFCLQCRLETVIFQDRCCNPEAAASFVGGEKDAQPSTPSPAGQRKGRGPVSPTASGLTALEVFP